MNVNNSDVTNPNYPKIRKIWISDFKVQHRISNFEIQILDLQTLKSGIWILEFKNTNFEFYIANFYILIKKIKKIEYKALNNSLDIFLF